MKIYRKVREGKLFFALFTTLAVGLFSEQQFVTQS